MIQYYHIVKLKKKDIMYKQMKFGDTKYSNILLNTPIMFRGIINCFNFSALIHTV